MKISIILLNYNNEEDTLECVNSIKKNSKLINEIIVVDNNSSEESKKVLKENKNNYKLILNKENNGFAAGNNIGIKYAIDRLDEYILLLNNDTIIEDDCIEKLVDCMESDSSIGIVSSRIMYYDNPDKIWYCGGTIDWKKYIAIHSNMGKKYKQEGSIIDTEFISGCCMLVRREVFEKVGLLPEEYFMYYEDVDFCKMVLDANYKLKVCTDSVIYHKVSSSSGGEDSPFSIKWCTRNRLIFMNKYKCDNYQFKSKTFFYSTRIIRAIQYLLKGEINKYKSLLEGIKLGREFNKQIHKK
ncbi:glycosyltransferase [Clostridium tertium]|uniref:N-acetylglucosaminyl-diphospho-decaprenol L-rhamnosyltransferase n=1 Tax=Clostridium tertium TaxID=1559 RepID=A0A6N2ZLZ4_9CLOT